MFKAEIEKIIQKWPQKETIQDKLGQPSKPMTRVITPGFPIEIKLEKKNMNPNPQLVKYWRTWLKK